MHLTHLYKPLMAHLGSALPATWTPSTWDDWREIQPGKTLILKPRFGGASKRRPTRGKLWRCSPEFDPAVVAHAIGLEPNEVVVQEVVPGPDHAIEVCFLYRRQDGAFGSLMTGRKLRQRPRGFGSASYLVTTQAVELAALARRTVEALGLFGLVSLEWKWNGEAWALIEINCRAPLYGAVAPDVILDAYHERAGLAPRAPRVTPPGTSWVYRAREPGLWATSDAIDALHTPDDPWPGRLGLPYTMTLALMKRLGRRHRVIP